MPLCKKSTKGIIYNNAIEALKNKVLVMKIMDGLQDYLSCEINISDDNKCALLGQPHLIKNLENKFGRLVKKVQSHKTPCAPKFLIVRPMEEIEKILIKDQ